MLGYTKGELDCKNLKFLCHGYMQIPHFDLCLISRTTLLKHM